jgi:hypothetical protein
MEDVTMDQAALVSYVPSVPISVANAPGQSQQQQQQQQQQLGLPHYMSTSPPTAGTLSMEGGMLISPGLLAQLRSQSFGLQHHASGPEGGGVSAGVMQQQQGVMGGLMDAPTASAPVLVELVVPSPMDGLEMEGGEEVEQDEDDGVAAGGWEQRTAPSIWEQGGSVEAGAGEGVVGAGMLEEGGAEYGSRAQLVQPVTQGDASTSLPPSQPQEAGSSSAAVQPHMVDPAQQPGALCVFAQAGAALSGAHASSGHHTSISLYRSNDSRAAYVSGGSSSTALGGSLRRRASAPSTLLLQPHASTVLSRGTVAAAMTNA